MKEYLIYGFLGIGALCVILAVVFCIRSFSNATTPVTVIEPVAGVQCVKIVTTDGAAVDCWKK